MSLREYHRKRDFKKTSEPRGKTRAKRSSLTFVVQKHAASHLHYDFRLELDGVLKSWAVPKGPDLDPSVKRLAMHVEDHPLEYGGFEGTIPQGEYGGGTVMVWDRGNWESSGDAAKGYRAGALKFTLHGEKLRGGWMLVRRGGKSAEPDERVWFLFKERDDAAETTGKPLVDRESLSVVSGRDLDEIAADADRVWGPDGETRKKPNRTKNTMPKTPTRNAKKPSTPKKTSAVKAAPKRTTIARRKRTKKRVAKGKTGKDSERAADLRKALAKIPLAKSFPKRFDVQLATLVADVPPGDAWVHEIKFDGYRMICRVEDGIARFISRNGIDWSKKFPELVVAAQSLALNDVVLDGEVVALDDRGVTQFQELQKIFREGRSHELIYYVFDVLRLDDHDVASRPLLERKSIAEFVVAPDQAKRFRYSEHFTGDGRAFFDNAGRLGLEGVISKRVGAPYTPGRGGDWLKIKCSKREEFVVGGFTLPEGSRKHFGALALGYHDANGELLYAGRVGTGFDAATLRDVAKTFPPLERKNSPFERFGGTTGQARGVHWLQPKLVAEVEFSNWTDDGHLRHPVFLGLRTDKAAAEVVRDRPLSRQEVSAMTESARNPKRSRPAPHAAKSDVTEFGGVTLTHPDKVLYPEQGITKSDLANYYLAVAEWMLPHVEKRPMALVRCPGGRGKACFFQKHPNEASTKFLREVDVSETKTPDLNLTVDTAAGLCSLVQMGVLEIHVWGSTVAHLEKPNHLIFDLDPDPSVDWADTIRAARETRVLLREFGLESFVKSTGGKGLHVVVPIAPRVEWDDAKAFCKTIADLMVRAAPDRFIATMSKAARKGKIFVDYLRNGRGATAIAPFSTRARPDAPVAIPLSWSELSPRKPGASFTIANVPARLAKLSNDPWAEMFQLKQSLTAKMRRRAAELLLD